MAHAPREQPATSEHVCTFEAPTVLAVQGSAGATWRLCPVSSPAPGRLQWASSCWLVRVAPSVTPGCLSPCIIACSLLVAVSPVLKDGTVQGVHVPKVHEPCGTVCCLQCRLRCRRPHNRSRCSQRIRGRRHALEPHCSPLQTCQSWPDLPRTASSRL